MNEIYRIKVKIENTEIEIESTDSKYVDSKFEALQDNYLLKKNGKALSNSSGTGSNTQKNKSITEFTRDIKPKSGTDYAVTIGYYLEKMVGQDHFNGSDIKNGFMSVKFKHSNPSDTINKAKATGKIMDGSSKGSYLLTSTGEEWVEERLR